MSRAESCGLAAICPFCVAMIECKSMSRGLPIIALRGELMKNALQLKKSANIAIPAAALGALAVGAFAIGALAIGRLVIGKLAIGRGKLKSLEIDELKVAKLRVRQLEVSDSLQLPPSN
jgi:hypothetical protein